jgi:hypothetical protein
MKIESMEVREKEQSGWRRGSRGGRAGRRMPHLVIALAAVLSLVGVIRPEQALPTTASPPTNPPQTNHRKTYIAAHEGLTRMFPFQRL